VIDNLLAFLGVWICDLAAGYGLRGIVISMGWDK
jgi:hypothetical protein